MLIEIKVKKVVTRIAELRGKVGLTQRELADAVGVDPSTIRNLETNRAGVKPLEKFVKMCEVLSCAPEELIEYEDI